MDFSDIFYYDETSPTCLRWKVEVRCGKNLNRVQKGVGDVAGTTSGRYPTVAVDNVKHYCHKIVWELVNGKVPDDMVIDHVDGDGQNNKVENLRLVSHAVNMRNQRRRARKNETVGVTSRVVVRPSGSVDSYWVAKWTDLNGKHCGKLFNINKHGNEQAKNLAIETRNKAIEELNKLGAGYSEEHGGAG